MENKYSSEETLQKGYKLFYEKKLQSFQLKESELEFTDRICKILEESEESDYEYLSIVEYATKTDELAVELTILEIELKVLEELIK